MAQNLRKQNGHVRNINWGLILLAQACIYLLVSPLLRAQQQSDQALEDITGDYQFLSPHDTLAILDEDGQLKGYIDVYQGESESDVVLSYTLSIGSHQQNHVEFKTSKIHEKHYRFSGTVERGSGHSNKDPDFLRLVGNLETITVNGITDKESVQKTSVVFKSKGKAAPESE